MLSLVGRSQRHENRLSETRYKTRGFAHDPTGNRRPRRAPGDCERGARFDSATTRWMNGSRSAERLALASRHGNNRDGRRKGVLEMASMWQRADYTTRMETLTRSTNRLGTSSKRAKGSEPPRRDSHSDPVFALDHFLVPEFHLLRVWPATNVHSVFAHSRSFFLRRLCAHAQVRWVILTGFIATGERVF